MQVERDQVRNHQQRQQTNVKKEQQSKFDGLGTDFENENENESENINENENENENIIEDETIAMLETTINQVSKFNKGQPTSQKADSITTAKKQSEEEDDYMSTDFLEKLEKAEEEEKKQKEKSVFDFKKKRFFL